MSDITKCVNEQCKLKDTCYRYTSSSSGLGQAYAKFEGGDDCEHYWFNKSNMKYLSGIRPSGRLHLGNYIGSILPAKKYNADCLVARYHEPDGDHKELVEQLSYFFSSDKIKIQELNEELYFKLLKECSVSLLEKMPQYKSKEKNALMLTYPVLMAHDLVGYDYVIVGDDQKSHIEIAKHLLKKVGLKCPEPIYEGGRVMDLKNPKVKMSKSNPNSCLFLDDENMEKKIMKAVTNKEGRENLEFIAKALGLKELPDKNITLKESIINLIKKL